VSEVWVHCRTQGVSALKMVYFNLRRFKKNCVILGLLYLSTVPTYPLLNLFYFVQTSTRDRSFAWVPTNLSLQRTTAGTTTVHTLLPFFIDECWLQGLKPVYRDSDQYKIFMCCFGFFMRLLNLNKLR
jgi:hypothetical protein